MPILRPLMLGALAGLSACRASSSPAPPVPRTSAYIVQLGRDTIAVEQFTRIGNRVEGTLATRAPRATLTRYVVTLNPDGSPSLVELVIRWPDGTPVADASRGVTVTFTGDSAITRLQLDTVVILRTSAPNAIPYVNYAMAFIQMPIDAMNAARADSIVSRILPIGSRVTTPFTIRYLGGNRYMAEMFGSRYDVRTGEGGVIISVDGTGTTQQFLASRRNTIDVTAVASTWAEQERLSRAMGPLSPRDTASAAIGAAPVRGLRAARGQGA